MTYQLWSMRDTFFFLTDRKTEKGQDRWSVWGCSLYEGDGNDFLVCAIAGTASCDTARDLVHSMSKEHDLEPLHGQTRGASIVVDRSLAAICSV